MKKIICAIGILIFLAWCANNSITLDGTTFTTVNDTTLIQDENGTTSVTGSWDDDIIVIENESGKYTSIPGEKVQSPYAPWYVDGWFLSNGKVVSIPWWPHEWEIETQLISETTESGKTTKVITTVFKDEYMEVYDGENIFIYSDQIPEWYQTTQSFTHSEE